MLYAASEYLTCTGTAPKALALARLQQLGYPVPPLLVVVDEHDFTVVAEHIRTRLPAKRYAVRFAAANEDTVTVSNAGRYVTKLDVASSDVAQALAEVVEESVAKLPAYTAYAIIIQEYIAAQCSGVAFTRHPQSHTTWLIEYAAGAGGVVGGEASLRIDDGAGTDTAKLPLALQKLCTLLPKIEKEFAWPQDIEWCSVGDDIFILQSRPITSIDERTWAAMSYLSTELANTPRYHYRSDSGVETYLNPRPLDYSLLQHLYGDDSAVAQAYARINIRYTPTDQFRQLGNRLYIDAEKEQQAIFPAYRMRRPGDYHTAWWPLSDVWQTAYNQAVLARAIPSTLVETALTALCALLAAPAPVARTIKEMLEILRHQYAIIFLCNYVVQRAECERIVTSSSTLLALLKKQYEHYPVDLVAGVTIGNSLSLDDNSLLVITKVHDFSLSRLTDVVRELARWQSIRLRTMMVDCVYEHGQARAISPTLTPYALLSELIHNDVKTEVWQQRKNSYERQENLPMPEVVSSWVIEDLEESLMISPGQASGVLLVPKDIAGASGTKEMILLVDSLTPDCVQYFDRVAGIVCRSGGLLSHAAIVAREQKIPVSRSAEINANNVGQRVTIADGRITVALKT